MTLEGRCFGLWRWGCWVDGKALTSPLISFERGIKGGGYLGEDFLDYVSVYVCEAEVSALVFVGEAFVVEAELVEDGGL